jgi:hypothetical protein
MRKLTLFLALAVVSMFSIASCKSHGSCPAYGNSSVKSIKSNSGNPILTKFTVVNNKK